MRANLEPKWFSTDDTDRKAVEFVLDVGRLPSGGDVKAPAEGGQRVASLHFTFPIAPRAPHYPNVNYLDATPLPPLHNWSSASKWSRALQHKSTRQALLIKLLAAARITHSMCILKPPFSIKPFIKQQGKAWVQQAPLP
jgi:hypothetical protein